MARTLCSMAYVSVADCIK